MNLRRKIAAALAAIMAVSSVGLVNLNAAVTIPNAWTRQGIEGALVGHANNSRLVDTNSPAAAANVPGDIHSGVDFLITGSQLLHSVGEHQSLRLRLDGYGIWNYGAPGIDGPTGTNNPGTGATRAIRNAAGDLVASSVDYPVVRPQQSNIGFITGPNLATATAEGAWGFFLPGTAPGTGTGTGANPDVLDILDSLPRVPGGTSFPRAQITWSNLSNRGYHVVNHVARYWSGYQTVGMTFTNWDFIPINGMPGSTAAHNAWADPATGFWGLPLTDSGAPGGVTGWMTRIMNLVNDMSTDNPLSMTAGAGATPNFFIVPIGRVGGSGANDLFTFAVVQTTNSPATTALTFHGVFSTEGYVPEAYEWVPGAWSSTAPPAGLTFPAGWGTGINFQAVNLGPGNVGGSPIGEASFPTATAGTAAQPGVWSELTPAAALLPGTPGPGGSATPPVLTAALPAWATSLQLGRVYHNVFPTADTDWVPMYGWDRTFRASPVAGAAGDYYAITHITGDGQWRFGRTTLESFNDYSAAHMPLDASPTRAWFEQTANWTPGGVVGRNIPVTATVQLYPLDTSGGATPPYSPDTSGGTTPQVIVYNQRASVGAAPVPAGAFVASIAQVPVTGGIVDGPAVINAWLDWSMAPQIVPHTAIPEAGGLPPLAPGTTRYLMPAIRTGATDWSVTANIRLVEFNVTNGAASTGSLTGNDDVQAGPIASGPGTANTAAERLATSVTAGSANAVLNSGVLGSTSTNIQYRILWPVVNEFGIVVNQVTGVVPTHANLGPIPSNPFGGGGTPGAPDARIITTQSIGNGPRSNVLHFSGRVSAQPTNRNEIPFTMTFLPGGTREVEITWTRANVLAFGNIENAVLRIPMAVQATGSGEIHVNVSLGNTGTGEQVGGDRQPITGPGQGVRLTVQDNLIARGNQQVVLNQLRLTEVGRGFIGSGSGDAFNRNRALTLTLPYGYVWQWTTEGTNAISWVTTGRMVGMPTPNATAFPSNLTRNTPIDAVGSGVAVGTPFIYTSNHPDTGQHRLHLVFNGWTPPVGTVGQIWVNNLRVAHRNPANPVFSMEEQNVTLVNGYGGGFMPTGVNMQDLINIVQGQGVETQERIWTAAGLNGISAVIAPAGVPAFVLAAQGLYMNRVTGAAGDLRTVIAGRTYTGPASLNPDVMPGTLDSFVGQTRRIFVEEVVPGAALNRELRFTLTDADGEPLDTAKIAAVQFGSGVRPGVGGAGMMNGIPANRNFHNAVAPQGSVHRFIGPAASGVTGNVAVTFSEDGRSVSINGLQPNDTVNRRFWLEATFFLSTDVNSDDPVYVTLAQRGPGMAGFDYDFVYPSATIQLANVDMLFEIDSEPTNIPHRAQRIDVEDVVVTELVSGALRQDRQVEIAIAELGVPTTRTDVGFNPINNNNVTTTGGLAVGVLPRPLGAHAIRMNVNSTSSRTTPGTLTLSDLDVFVNQAVPVGTYGVVARGNAILDNDAAELNRRLGGGINPSAPMYRRYGFGGLLFEPFMNITMPGAYGTGGGAVVDPSVARVTARQNSAFVEIDDRVVTMTNVNGQATPMFHYAGTNFFPMRGIAQVYGSEHAVAWTFLTPANDRTVDWAPGVEVEVTINLGSRTIVFTTGSTTFTVNGIANTMPAGQTPRNVAGTVFIPFAALGHALGVPVSWYGYGADQMFFFNQPERGTIVTLNGNGGAVAPVDLTEPVDYEYNGEEENGDYDDEDAA